MKGKKESFPTNTYGYCDISGLRRAFEEEQMKQTTYKVVTSDGQRLGHDVAFFEHESEARTYARAAAQGGRKAYVMKVETEFLAFYAPETAGEAKRSGATE